MGVRTVQRYERELRLPVHRPAEKSRSSVIAFKAELDRWVQRSSVQVDERIMRLGKQTNHVGAEFLLIDVEVALTLSGLALKTNNAEKKERQSATALKAYNTIMRLRANLDLNEAERGKLDAGLHRLRGELRQLGKKL